MRLKENVERHGYFWLPSAPERRLPGTLVIKDSGNIDLKVVGLFATPETSMLSSRATWST